MAAVAFAMRVSIGPVLVSGPTDVAVSNMASRIMSVSKIICADYNRDLDKDSGSRMRHWLAVRGTRTADDYLAFVYLLQNQDAREVPRRVFRGPSCWQLPLSPTYWLLMALGARVPGVPGLHSDASRVLYDLRECMRANDVYEPLLSVATGKTTWEESGIAASGSKLTKGVVMKLLDTLGEEADMLCVTPARAENFVDFRVFKHSRAKCIVVDEAGAMRIPDLMSVWVSFAFDV